MAVNTPQIQIDPYTSTVPLVQVPQEDLATPPPAQRLYTRKAGMAELGDNVFRGLLRGLQVKEERKYATAQASVNALDKSTSDAYENYQRALATGKKEEADAAYGVYLTQFNAAKEAKAQFAIPDHKPKDKKKTDKKDDQGGVATGGFGAGLKQFFERNPHIIPELSLLAMQPKPPGPTPEVLDYQNRLKETATAQQADDLKLAEAQKKAANEKTYQDGYATFAGLSQEQVAALPPDAKKQYDAWLGAKAALTPMTERGSRYRYTLPNGSEEMLYPDEAEQVGAKLSAKGAEAKPGTVADFITTVARDNKIPIENLNAGQKGYLTQLGQFYEKNPTASQNTSWYIDDKGDWQTRTAPGYHGPVAPKPSPGLFPRGFILPGGKPQAGQGGITAPPAQASPQNVFRRNQQWAKQGPYVTQLNPQEEQQFQAWAKQNKVPWQDSPTADYDMRGYWKALQSGDPIAKQSQSQFDGKMHFPDKWKTPYHKTFSGESMYATQGAPTWQGNVLKDAQGNVIADETPGRKTATSSPRGGISAPPGHQPMHSWQAAQNTQKVETEKKDRYAAAEKKRDAAISLARTKAKTPEAFEQLKKQANDEFEADKNEIGKWYSQQVKAVGGSVDPKPPAGATIVYRNKDGKVAGWAVNGQFVASAGQ